MSSTSASRAIYSFLYPGREIVVRVLPPGALACPKCGWVKETASEFPTIGMRSYYCPPCLRATGSAVALQEVAPVAG